MTPFRYLLLAALAAVLPLSAHAEPAKSGAWYVGLGAMPVFESNADSNVDSTTDIIKYHTGWGVTGSGGYAWGNGIRTEGEIAYRRNSVKEITGTGSGTNDGSFSTVSFMGNVLYDFNTGTRFTPYVGAGIGLGVVSANDIKTVVSRTVDDTRTTFAYQAIAGVSAAIDKNWAITADYRYFRTLDEKFKTSLDDRATTDNASHNVVIGVRYTFSAPEYVPPVEPLRTIAAPAPAAPAAAAPAVPAVPQSYMVFFDFDKSILTPEAKRIIAAAAEDFKSGKYVRILVTGHTDTMGTNRYNQKLSERRATAVKKEFEHLGVPAKEIASSGVGEAGLLVPTNDQVREAQNRRAEIVFNK